MQNLCLLPRVRSVAHHSKRLRALPPPLLDLPSSAVFGHLALTERRFYRSGRFG